MEPETVNIEPEMVTESPILSSEEEIEQERLIESFDTVKDIDELDAP